MCKLLTGVGAGIICILYLNNLRPALGSLNCLTAVLAPYIYILNREPIHRVTTNERYLQPNPIPLCAVLVLSGDNKVIRARLHQHILPVHLRAKLSDALPSLAPVSTPKSNLAVLHSRPRIGGLVRPHYILIANLTP